MSETMSGGCACGKVRYTAQVASDEAYLCHCRMCQRSSGNVSLAMMGIEQAAVEWAGEPDWYRSSAIAERPFCARCGTSLGFRY
ncbi:MAG: GFA family protein, partial [Pseudomonadota bacterium]